MKLLTQYAQIDAVAWDRLIAESPVASWFQTREAYCFFDSLSFMEAFVVAVADGEKLTGLVVGYIQGDGGVLKRKLSRRAIIIGGPLLFDEITDGQLSAMLNMLSQSLRQRCIYIETRNLNDYSKWRKTFEECGFDYEPHYNFHQDTTSLEIINNKLSRTRKRHVRVGLRDGATLSIAVTDDEANAFYDILSVLYRNKVKKPLPPREFFQKMRQLASAKILLVKCQNRVIGGMAYVALTGRTGYEWYVCGMDETCKNLYPSELATYAGLCQSAAEGCPRFDFMGAGKPGVPYGVRDFKALFGGELVEHGRFLHVNSQLVYRLGKAFVTFQSRFTKR